MKKLLKEGSISIVGFEVTQTLWNASCW